MAQQVKMIDTKFDYLSSILGSHMVGGENQFSQVVLWAPHVYSGMCVHIHTLDK